jgi:hypothetical protein
MKVFVLLARHRDARQWKEANANGMVPDESPYGYHHARTMGCEVEFSEQTPKRGLFGLLDKVLNRVLGIEFGHVWNNRKALFGGKHDVVWTHTEREFMPVLAVAALTMGRRKHPPMICQIVWLLDRWDQLQALPRWIYTALLARADVLTFHSTKNAALARQHGLCRAIEVVRFGVSADAFPCCLPRAKRRSPDGEPLRVLALGNDVHRDWETLNLALGDVEGIAVKIGSSTFPSALLATNFQVSKMSQTDIRDSYEWCDCVVVPLRENMHASGLTVCLETVMQGIPLFVTDTGGLRDYFEESAVTYLAVGDGEMMRKHVLNLESMPLSAMTTRAQAHSLDREFTSEGFAKRHVELSRRLLRRSA